MSKKIVKKAVREVKLLFLYPELWDNEGNCQKRQRVPPPCRESAGRKAGSGRQPDLSAGIFLMAAGKKWKAQ
jgi:hypothetical protein